MNMEFERAMQNRFAKRVHSLDPTKDSYLFSEHGQGQEATFDAAAPLSSRRTTAEYTKMSSLVADANAKWVVCPTKADDPTAAIGQSDNFFKQPKAYEKFIGVTDAETVPQCKTLDPVTGCVKCV